MLRTILIGLLVLVVLVVAAAFVAPMLIPTDWLRDKVAAQVKAATGRDLTINGEITLQLLPTASVNLHDVKFANFEGGSRPDMATLKEMRVHVAVLPLLSSEVEIKEFTLVEPNILLEVNKAGQANWTFADPQKQAPAADRPPEAQGSAEGGRGLGSLKLGEVQLQNGRLEYRDARTGTAESVENVNVTIDMPDWDHALKVDGSLAWHAKALQLVLTADKPRALSEGGASPMAISLSGDLLKLAYEGSLDAGAMQSRGKLDLDVPSVRGLADWAGKPLAIQGEALGPLKITGQVAAGKNNVNISDLNLAVDEVTATGSLAAAIGGAVPTINASLDVGDLNLNPYLQAFGAPTAASPSPPDQSPPAGKPASAGWSDEPIDFSPLRSINANVDLKAKSIEAQNLKLGESVVAATLNGGKLNVDLSKLALYGGVGVANIAVDASGDVPAISQTIKVTKVQARPLLTDAADLNWLSGTAGLNIDVTTRGKSQKAMVSALNGKGNVAFLNGSVYGINLAAMVRNAADAFLNQSTETVKTDFAELSGSFTIKNGVVSNNDLKLLSPLLRILGAGTVSLPPRTVDYRLEPKAVASLKGQGGDLERAGLYVPVLITGPWSSPTIQPDMAGAIHGLAKDPSQLLKGDTLQDPAGKLNEMLKGGGDSKGTPAPSGGKSSNPLKQGTEQLKGLFGR